MLQWHLFVSLSQIRFESFVATSKPTNIKWKSNVAVDFVFFSFFRVLIARFISIHFFFAIKWQIIISRHTSYISLLLSSDGGHFSTADCNWGKRKHAKHFFFHNQLDSSFYSAPEILKTMIIMRFEFWKRTQKRRGKLGACHRIRSFENTQGNSMIIRSTINSKF